VWIGFIGFILLRLALDLGVFHRKAHAIGLKEALVAVECTDVLFAVDFVPAIVAITAEPSLVFSSNVLTTLGLRSLYFALAGIMDRSYYPRLSLIILLGLIGVKMLLKDVLHAVPGLTYYTLGAVAVALSAGVAAYLVRVRGLEVEAPGAHLHAKSKAAESGNTRDAPP
jgi:predicted tellurium resistance membrane protein TerC